MQVSITKNAPLLQGKGGRQSGKRKQELFAELDKLEVMDLLTVQNEKSSALRSLVTQYKKLHPEKDFRTRIDGDEIKIQRLGVN